MKARPLAVASLFLGFLFCITLPPVEAGNLEDGIASYNTRKYAQALRLLKPLAKKGNASAQSYLGLMYANGSGVTKNDKQAVKWLRKAAKQGHSQAKKNLAFMSANGRGTDSTTGRTDGKNDSEEKCY